MSGYLASILAGWFMAQGGKYLLSSLRSRNFKDLHELYISGGMPSAHSATVVALMTYIGLQDGFSSGLFGLATLFAGIVMYDAVMVRRSSGKQGEALEALTWELKTTVKAPKIAKGHEPLEVLAGVIVGIVVGIVVFIATR